MSYLWLISLTDYSAFIQVYNVIIQEGEFGLIVNPFIQIGKNFIII